MDKANNEKSYRSKESIDECDDRLCLKYETKSTSHLLSDDGPFVIKKSKVAIFYLSEKLFYLLAIDNKEIGEYERDKKLRKYNPCICDIGYCFLSDRFEIIRADHITDKRTETEFETGTFFYFFDKVLSLDGDFWSFFQESLYLSTDLRKDIYKDKDDNADKHNIESRDDDICGRIFLSEFMSCIDLSTHSPVVNLYREVCTEFKKYVSK